MDSTLVYSTGPDKPGLKKQSSFPDGAVRVGRETQGRRGQGVTVITGLPLPQDRLEDLARRLKRHCGAGGTVKGRVIEIQGDHRDRVIAALAALGYQSKRTGG